LEPAIVDELLSEIDQVAPELDALASSLIT